MTIARIAEVNRGGAHRALLFRLGGGALLFIAVSAAIYAALSLFAPMRVGDGGEYYAMERSLSLSKRPFMTAEGWAAYKQMAADGEVAGLVPSDTLRNTFPALHTTHGEDFNHFWAYPAAAAAAGYLSDLIGITRNAHQHFMLLHAGLFAGLLMLCFALDRWRGVGAATLILCASPVLWFTTKVHTEFATVVLTIASVGFASKRMWAMAGLMLAAVTTQNISFALPAFLCCSIALLQIGSAKVRGVRAAVDAVALAASALLACLHPAYYFFRFGGITPQLISYGADTSSISPLASLQYLLDPDIGLLPNWPLGAVLLLAAAFFVARSVRQLPAVSMSLFTMTYVFAALAAQSATTNINSGATVSVARYGLWYICLFYPCIVYLSRQLDGRNKFVRLLVATAVALLIAHNTRVYNPNKGESYLTPTAISQYVYKYTPWLWTPAPEVFMERYSGRGEKPIDGPLLVVGPGCVQALFIPGPESQPVSRVQALPAGACRVSSAQFRRHLESKFPVLPAKATYFSLAKSELSQMQEASVQDASGEDAPPLLPLGVTVTLPDLANYLGEGWSAPERWGVWSDGARSGLNAVVPGGATELVIGAFSFTHGARTHAAARVLINGSEGQSLLLSKGNGSVEQVTLRLPLSNRPQVVFIELIHDDPVSPSELGLGSDDRRISIGLVSLEARR